MRGPESHRTGILEPEMVDGHREAVLPPDFRRILDSSSREAASFPSLPHPLFGLVKLGLDGNHAYIVGAVMES